MRRVYTEDGGEHSWDSDSEENCLDAGYSESPNPPKELIAFRTGSNQSTAVLNWTPPSIYDNKELLHYNIYREGELINSEPYFDTIYYDDNIGPEDICYEITAVYSQAGESEPSNVACAMMVWGTNELEINTSIYPNPAASILKIEAEHQIKNIKILNELGQNLMISGDIIKQYYQLDISGFENGLYFLAIEFEKGVITKKLIIQK
ncbi:MULTISPECIES: T9SS type A sorting domain-containing protein [unclassified Lentimicrobium]|uniref:T9SS type A sorting domain-containing protein n=1 Tax=unclassified Lentimicrobium TaxID=2677434 RepID=UPI00155336BA|nr:MULTISPECIES: T9SS type A sorting domain-containing protein [unclassified Lentimicrobium]NPD44542.1 T9SS type A sorting domain-containing protein [Lentimicrobium sp. S6]NPD85641.1 T9SS type A sorting domain-containing protein [Lentimicrobium sp. L6]